LVGGKIYEGEKKLYTKNKELKFVEEASQCSMCDACVKVCPTHIDIRKAPSQLECINCLECADACTEVQSAFNRPSLISWSNEPANIEKRKPRYFRPRIIIYNVVLFMLTVGLFVIGSQKEYMLLNINRTTQLYKIKDEKVVENAYTFLFQNTDSYDHEYYFKVNGNDKIEIKRPSKPFLLKAGSKVRKIVILRAKESLSSNTKDDTTIPVQINAFATDESQKIFVQRNTTFIYPKLSEFLK